MQFADVHCHILFGVDDGAETESEMYEMLDCAYQNGVRAICATPHCNPEMFDHSPEAEDAAFQKLKDHAGKNYPDMAIFHANEFFVHSDTPSAVTEQNVGIFPDGQTVLIEFYPDRTPSQIEATVKRLNQHGYTALLAHIERYSALKRGSVIDLKELDALISVNAESIIGANGRHTQKRALKLLSLGLVDIITSDSHKKDGFLQLLEAYTVLSKNYSEDWLRQLFYETPAELLDINK